MVAPHEDDHASIQECDQRLAFLFVRCALSCKPCKDWSSFQTEMVIPSGRELGTHDQLPKPNRLAVQRLLFESLNYANFTFLKHHEKNFYGLVSIKQS